MHVKIKHINSFAIFLYQKKIFWSSIHRIGSTSICVMLPLFGVTWVLGAFSLNKDLVIFQYLFSIFNSLQVLQYFYLYYVVKCSFNKDETVNVCYYLKRIFIWLFLQSNNDFKSSLYSCIKWKHLNVTSTSFE